MSHNTSRLAPSVPWQQQCASPTYPLCHPAPQYRAVHFFSKFGLHASHAASTLSRPEIGEFVPLQVTVQTCFLYLKWKTEELETGRLY